VKKQQETDKQIAELVQTMVTTFSFVENTHSLPGKIEGLENTCLAIPKQTVECAMFIREYTGKGFGGEYFPASSLCRHSLYKTARLVTQAVSDSVTRRIGELSKALNELKESFDSCLGIHTAFVCAAIKENLLQVGMWILLFGSGNG
jgi:hypothetical protein